MQVSLSTEASALNMQAVTVIVLRSTSCVSSSRSQPAMLQSTLHWTVLP